MDFKRLSFWPLIFIIILTIAVGCESSEPAATELVPEHINLIGNIKVKKIMNDQDLIDAYNKAKKEPKQPQTAEEALNQAIEETGIDFRDISEAVIFAKLTTLQPEEYIGFIVKGAFNEKQFIDTLGKETNREFVTSDYKNYKLYIDEEEEFSIAFLSNKTLLLGSIGAVQDVIDVKRGDSKPVSGIVLDTYNQLGDVLIKFAFEFPEEARKALIEEAVPSEIPMSFEALADIDILGFSLNKEIDTISVKLSPHFLSKDSAEDAKDMIIGAISLFKGILPDPEIKELLGKIEVSVTDSWIAIDFKITISEIEQLLETFQQ